MWTRFNMQKQEQEKLPRRLREASMQVADTRHERQYKDNCFLFYFGGR